VHSLGDLHSQLSGRHENEYLRDLPASLDELEQGQSERGCLSRACRGEPEQITSRQ